MALLDQLQTELGSTYRLDRELAGGGMARVFVATEVALGRSVVIKVLRAELAADVMVERFTREIQLAARLQQANIVPLFFAGHTSHGPFYTMPLVEGASLRQRLADGAPLTPAEVVAILRDIARALAYAHDAGVVHRDIKPENVLLSGGAAVVTDFGIAKAVSAARTDASQGPTLTQIGMGVGTPAYMSPEQATGDPSVDHRADIYAFGCLAYELLVGHPPFHGRPLQQMIVAQIAEVPPPVSTQCGAVSPVLASLVDRCLEKSADRRPQHARELLDALDGFATPTFPGIAAPRVPRRRLAVGAAVVVVAIGLAAAAYALVERRAPPAPAGADPSLAVIPFANVGGDSTQDYLADGVSDELATAIGKLPGLRMTARSAAYRFRGRRDLDVRELGKALSARYLVQGTLRHAGDQLRVSVQLSDASTGDELWSETFNRTSGDVFRTQDDITAAITHALSSRLRPSAVGPAGKPGPAAQGTADPVAYDEYLRGEFLFHRRQVGAAIEMYRSAIAHDSMFARAYAGLSDALALTVYFSATPPGLIRAQVMAAANRALALNGGLAEAYTSLGEVYAYAFEWGESQAALEKAVAADPNDVEARVQFGRLLYLTGRDSAAMDQWRRAQALDPFNALPAAWMALLLSDQGKRAEALAQTHRALEYDSTAVGIWSLAAQAFVRSGDFANARAFAFRLPSVPPWAGDRGYVLAIVGDTAQARGVIRAVERMGPGVGFRDNSLAMAYVGLGDTARALDAFERATDAHEPWPMFQRVSAPIYDSLRKSARWAALVRRVGLERAPGALP